MRLVALSFLGLLAACQTTASDSETVRICDSAGCYDAPAEIATFDPSRAGQDPDPEGRLPGLVAAAEADPRAAFDLGMRYMRGDGIRRNPYQAIRWMRDAGGRGDARAQSALGRLYMTGLEEMGPDYNEAQRWLSLAAAQGDREARTLLAEAEARRADEAAFQEELRRWREQYTQGYWYRTGYYGYWGGGRYRYY
jgi:TPR repeat protein